MTREEIEKMPDEEFKAESERGQKLYDETMRRLVETGQESAEIEAFGRTFEVKRDPEYVKKLDEEERKREEYLKSPDGQKTSWARKTADETGQTIYVTLESGMRLAFFPRKKKE